MPKQWFGKGCNKMGGVWEREELSDPNHREYEPVLKYCAHLENPENTEGNCRPAICPKLIKNVNLLKCETCQYLKECSQHYGALTEVENCSAMKGTHFCKASWDLFVALMGK